MDIKLETDENIEKYIIQYLDKNLLERIDNVNTNICEYSYMQLWLELNRRLDIKLEKYKLEKYHGY